MAIPVAVKAAKVAVTVLSDKKLRKIVGGIVLGVIFIIFAPITILHSVFSTGQSIDWESPEMQQSIIDNMSDEEKARLQAFADTMEAIETEISAQELDVEPIRAQVIFISVIQEEEITDQLITDFIACFADTEDDADFFSNLESEFGVTLTAEEKDGLMLLCEKAEESQTVPATGTHAEIDALTDDDTPVSETGFTSPFRDRDWEASVTSNFGTRTDPITGEKKTHSGLDIAAPTGTDIHPIKAGTVLYVRNDTDGYGKYLVVNHGGGQSSLYAHCSEILVSSGDTVTADTVIAKVGSTGRSTGPHLHLEIIISGKPKNPKTYLEVNQS